MKAVHYRSADCAHLAVLGKPGRKFTKMVLIDYPVRMTKVLNASAEKYAREMPTMTLKQVCRKFLQAGKRMGITKGARELLKAGLNE